MPAMLAGGYPPVVFEGAGTDWLEPTDWTQVTAVCILRREDGPNAIPRLTAVTDLCSTRTA